jgi:hypothetical protein
MNRSIQFRLNKVSPIPAGLRVAPSLDAPASEVDINLGQLFLQYYFDSYPGGPPNPDPSRFEYLQLVNSDSDFRFHAYVADASTIKLRSLSAEVGQAFCRLMLHDHFGYSVLRSHGRCNRQVHSSRFRGNAHRAGRQRRHP